MEVHKHCGCESKPCCECKKTGSELGYLLCIRELRQWYESGEYRKDILEKLDEMEKAIK